MIKNIVIFSLGVIVGSLVTRSIIKDKYEQLAQEEIESVKSVYFKKRDSEDKPEYDPAGILEDEEDLEEYEEVVKENKYIPEEESEEDEPDYSEYYIYEPYVITPEEFGTIDEYDIEKLTYYDDETLEKENGDIVKEDEIYGLIGDALDTFGDYDENCVYVRDDGLKVDYEIFKDERRYFEALASRPAEE